MPPALLLVVGAVVLAVIGGPQASMFVSVGLVVLLTLLVLGRFVLVLVLVRRISDTDGATARALGAILGSALSSSGRTAAPSLGSGVTPRPGPNGLLGG